jgi:arylsulfatase A-like enzyme
MPRHDQPFAGHAERDSAASTPGWPTGPRPPTGSPNVVVIMLDDVGFAQLGCYGSSIATPNIDRLAESGLLFNNFHTTALCSPSRASLLTGRTPHNVGIGTVMELAAGYPGYDAQIPRSAATLARILQTAGWNSWAVGKWHLTPDWQRSVTGPYDTWPLGLGFERFYGFLGADTDQYHPTLIADNHPVATPATPEEGYHLSEDLADQSIQLLTDQTSVDPDKPFFLYLAFGACHAPHQAPAAYIDKYEGAFDDGWDVERERILERQLALGVVPPGTRLSPPNQGVAAWADLTDDQRRVYTRMHEVYAGFLEHTDAQIGRVLDHLTEIDRRENTIVVLVSDNGASPEGGDNGRYNEMTFFNGINETVPELLKRLDTLGGPEANNHYPMGWAQAGNTPLKWYKQNTHGGGIRDPLLVSWPARITSGGEVREQYLHISDLMPTILELAGVAAPDTLDGVPQQPIEGISAAYLLDDAQAESRRTSQHYEMIGNRAMYADGWKAVTAVDPRVPIYDQVWELYHVAEDFAELHDLAEEHPERLAELIAAWEQAASANNLHPVDHGTNRILGDKPTATPARRRYVYYRGMQQMPEGTTHDVRNVAHRIEAPTVIGPEGADGVLFAQGGRFGGFVLYVHDDRLVYDYNMAGAHSVVRSEEAIPTGDVTLAMGFTPSAAGGGEVVLTANGNEIGRGHIAATIMTRYTLDEGFDVGRDLGTPVCDAYECPAEFTGELPHVTIEITDAAPPPDGEANLRTALGRQ